MEGPPGDPFRRKRTWAAVVGALAVGMLLTPGDPGGGGTAGVPFPGFGGTGDPLPVSAGPEAGEPMEVDIAGEARESEPGNEPSSAVPAPGPTPGPTPPEEFVEDPTEPLPVVTTTVTETVTESVPPPTEPPAGDGKAPPTTEGLLVSDPATPPQEEEEDEAGLTWRGEDMSGPLTGGEAAELVEPSAWCNDGTLVFVERRRGACADEGGVAVWLKLLPR
ncbi:DUF3761 domain-containing protein [Streptomyces sp. ST2-7A]|uniref:DUF3761 domain-containing protein n=1 Tax=Streptomyces sp. ST2-7A TaxID=2907214 RepID=UPI001F3C912F|nr:DUF3761 domain-containing protein [Streptomyces sp. ST2-7A]